MHTAILECQTELACHHWLGVPRTEPGPVDMGRLKETNSTVQRSSKY